MATHDGHRERLKERFLQQGSKGFNDLNLLELLLFYAIPRKDTNELAHALLAHFGTLNAVLDATVQELKAVPGVGDNTALFLTLIPQVAQRYLEPPKELSVLRGSGDAKAFFLPRLRFEKNEKILLVCLDTGGRILSCDEMNEGTSSAVTQGYHRIVETAIRKRASGIVLAHNHPHGVAMPSYEDRKYTQELKTALRLIEIPLLDHIVVGGSSAVSFSEHNLCDCCWHF